MKYNEHELRKRIWWRKLENEKRMERRGRGRWEVINEGMHSNRLQEGREEKKKNKKNTFFGES